MKRLLVVVDYQTDFVVGSLGNEYALKLEDRIADKIKLYEKNGDDVVFTLDTHDENYLSSKEGNSLPVLHCLRNSSGHELYGKVKELGKNHLKFEKGTFASSKLYEYLSTHFYDEIELVGVVTNICVISNAVIARCASKESLIIVDASCVASNDKSLNDKALDVMESLQVKVINKE